MIFLIAAVVLVGLLCVFDLLLTLAVLRRLREHSAELGRLGTGPDLRTQMYDPQILVGTKAPDLAGESGVRLVAFLDAHCESCHEHAAEFAETARAHDDVLAIVSGEGREADELRTLVGPGIPLVQGEDARTRVLAIGLRAFPTFLLVEADGTIVQAVTEPGALTRPVPAT
ncbi:hypothetical protein [Streptomyces sp. AC550_RSS872]|uniref:hypothetical protein n=1 Tax=Streptomyces sp. AC550_RSS872 TaxID=2823689 RepID=UPI001C256CD8|nr:hypothetical protein [Streptomyces sp. AC550_RSS872]